MLLTNPAAVLLDVTDSSRQYTKRQRRQPAAAAPAPTRNKAKRERQSATAETVPHPTWKENHGHHEGSLASYRILQIMQSDELSYTISAFIDFHGISIKNLLAFYHECCSLPVLGVFEVQEDLMAVFFLSHNTAIEISSSSTLSFCSDHFGSRRFHFLFSLERLPVVKPKPNQTRQLLTK